MTVLPLHSRPHRKVAGFFVVDLLLALGMLSLLGVIYQTGAKRAALRAKGEDVKADLAALVAAMTKVDKTLPAPAGVPVDFSTLRPHLKADSQLAQTGKDALGNPFPTLILGQFPTVPAATVASLHEVTDAEFWKPFPIPRTPVSVPTPTPTAAP